MSAKRFSFDVHVFCALPLVRRVYQALVVGLAVFILTLVALREPFRGYLAEVRISGPAMEGLDLTAAASWLKQADREVAVATSRGSDSAGRGQIRTTFVAPRASAATRHLDELAERWLYQYLPNRLMAHRHAALAEMRGAAQAARDRENETRAALEIARQRQIASVLQSAEERATLSPALSQRERGQWQPRQNEDAASSVRNETTATPAESVSSAPVGKLPEPRSSAAEKLEKLRLELSELLSNFTEQHPQVITLKALIATLEKEINAAPSAERHGARSLQNAREINSDATKSFDQVRAVQHFTSTTAVAQLKTGDAAVLSDGTDIESLVAALSQAGLQRQTAEDRLTERMQELSNQAAASQWSAAPAAVVTRLGGTPRLSVLALASLLASVVGGVIFRAAVNEPCSPKITSTAELASAMELPVVGNLLALRAAAAKMRRRILTPGRLKVAMHVAEVVVVLAVAACLVSIVLEPALSRQVLADPFGTLSEVIGRNLGRRG